MVTEAPTYRCFLCGSRIDIELCEGRYIRAWKVTACKHCLNCCHSGIEPTKTVLAKLKAAHIDFRLNAAGSIDWPEAVGERAPIAEEVRPPKGRRFRHGFSWKHA